jgi:molybdopterin-synthase adenylyltransferase
MPTSRFSKPLLPSHYFVWFEPPNESGDEVLHIVSGRRSLTLKGYSFREFHQRVVPLLDGRHSVDEIRQETADLFREEDLIASLEMLGEHGVLVEGDIDGPTADVAARLAPQLNFFHDTVAHEAGDSGQAAQARLAAATVAIVGLGGAGAGTAIALGAAGVGTVRCVDWLPIAPADVYLSPFLRVDDVGVPRATAIARQLRASAPQVQAPTFTDPLDSEDGLRGAIAGADVVVCCLDAGQSNLIYKLNRVCLADGVRWIACSLDGAEITVGPALHPGRGPCYLCYRMRAVACAGNPEEAFAFERQLDRRKRDESGRRENLVFGAGLAANLLGLEVVKELTGIAEPSLVGRLLTIQLADLGVQKHMVLRKPWCPACFAPADASRQAPEVRGADRPARAGEESPHASESEPRVATSAEARHA